MASAADEEVETPKNPAIIFRLLADWILYMNWVKMKRPRETLESAFSRRYLP